MRRQGRRRAGDYLENEELNETFEGYEEPEETEADNESQADEEEPKKSVWVKIGKVAVVILVLIALFFVSMKVTEIFLDRNSEPDYSSDIPAYSDTETEQDDEDIPEIREYEDEEVPEYKEYEEQDKTPVRPDEDNKAEEDKKTEETTKPAEKPEETQKPSTEPSPSTPSKPVIVPGNPAA